MTATPWIVVASAVFILFIILRRKAGRAPSEAIMSSIRTGAKIIDVRSAREFRGGAYPNAINIPLQSLSSRMSEIPKEKPVVLYCASGARSATAAKVLQDAGYTNVLNAGGLGDMPR